MRGPTQADSHPTASRERDFVYRRTEGETESRSSKDELRGAARSGVHDLYNVI